MHEVPFSEPPWLCGLPSPYYNESHWRWQKYCRDFIDENLTKYALDWENAEEVPEEVYSLQNLAMMATFSTNDASQQRSQQQTC